MGKVELFLADGKKTNSHDSLGDGFFLIWKNSTMKCMTKLPNVLD